MSRSPKVKKIMNKLIEAQKGKQILQRVWDKYSTWIVYKNCSYYFLTYEYNSQGKALREEEKIDYDTAFFSLT